MRIDLRHKVVCITGAAGGIGRAIAEAFAKEGAHLALIDFNAEGLEELAAKLRTEEAVVNTAVADLRTEQGVQEGMLAALAPYEGRERYQGGRAANEQQLADRVGGDQPLALRVVDRE